MFNINRPVATSQIDPADWRWLHFTPQELASRGNGTLLINEAALDALQLLRYRCARPLVIHSAYRDPLYNARIGGAPKSYHKTGQAFDIAWPDMDKATCVHLAKQSGFYGIGIYSSFIHVDQGPERIWGNT